MLSLSVIRTASQSMTAERVRPGGRTHDGASRLYYRSASADGSNFRLHSGCLQDFFARFLRSPFEVSGIPRKMAARCFERTSPDLPMLAPLQHSTARGGHQPWIACCRRKRCTAPMKTSHLRSRRTPSAKPPSPKSDASILSARSISQSRPSSRRWRVISLRRA